MARPLPPFIPRENAPDGRGRLRRVAMLLALVGYVGCAVAQDGPLQVWLLVLAPFALVALATALRIIDPSEPG
jgi:hypothetical protein